MASGSSGAQGKDESPSRIHIYWPSSQPICREQAEPLHIVGWALRGGPGEVVIVVASLHTIRSDEPQRGSALASDSAGTSPFISSVTSKHPASGEVKVNKLRTQLLGLCHPFHPISTLHEKTSLAYSDAVKLKQAELITSERRRKGKAKAISFDENYDESSDPWLDRVWLDVVSPSISRSSWRSYLLDVAKRSVPQIPHIVRLDVPVSETGIGPAISIIIYSRPRPHQLQFLSLEPLVLQREPFWRLGVLGLSDRKTAKRSAQADLQRSVERLAALDPDRHFEVTGGWPTGHAPGDGLAKAVQLMNDSQLIDVPRASRLPASIQRSWRGAIEQSMIWKASGTVAQAGLRTMHNFFHIPIMKAGSQGVTLRYLSCTASQLDVRILQLSLWPTLGRRLRLDRMQGTMPISELSAHYVGLWNGVWLVANDLILGYAVGEFLTRHCDTLSQEIQTLARVWASEHVTETLAWLSDWPAGLKLNTELSLFFGDMYQGLTSVWTNEVLSVLLPHLSSIIWFAGRLGQCLGLSLVLAVAIDLLRLLTLHLEGFHLVSKGIFDLFIHVLDVLFNLFRGKKRNPLRNGRVDNAVYELDQLLLGTIFFTLLAFLFPTVLVYYLLFAISHLVIVTARYGLETCLAILGNLPIFPMMLRIKEPNRLPSSISLRALSISSRRRSDGASDVHAQGTFSPPVFVLESIPLSVGDIMRDTLYSIVE